MAADVQAPRVRVDVRDVVVDQEVVQAGGRDVVPEGLERHPVVPRRELKLLARDPLDAGHVAHLSTPPP